MRSISLLSCVFIQLLGYFSILAEIHMHIEGSEIVVWPSSAQGELWMNRVSLLRYKFGILRAISKNVENVKNN